MHPSRWSPPSPHPQRAKHATKVSKPPSMHHQCNHNRRKRNQTKSSSNHHPFHIFKSKSNSSKRVQAAHLAHIAHTTSVIRLLRKQQNNRKLRKDIKLALSTIEIPPPSPKLHASPIPPSFIQKNHVVIDGGHSSNPPLCAPKDPLSKPWFSLSISRGDLRIADTKHFFKADTAKALTTVLAGRALDHGARSPGHPGQRR